MNLNVSELTIPIPPPPPETLKILAQTLPLLFWNMSGRWRGFNPWKFSTEEEPCSTPDHPSIWASSRILENFENFDHLENLKILIILKILKILKILENFEHFDHFEILLLQYWPAFCKVDKCMKMDNFHVSHFQIIKVDNIHVKLFHKIKVGSFHVNKFSNLN